MRIYIHIRKMASKNLAVKEEVYKKLLESKKGDESFSDVIERLLSGKSDIMSFAGALSGDKEFDSAVRDIREARKRALLRS